MLKRRRIREKGKVSLSRYFQELKAGDRVTILRNLSQPASFPKRIQGMTGEVKEKRGKAYIVRLRRGRQVKEFIITPLHLKKIKASEAKVK